MIGLVTHCYPNGSFVVFFADGQFGAKGFSKALPPGERFQPGDRIDCEFSPEGRGTVIKAVRVAAAKPVIDMGGPAKVVNVEHKSTIMEAASAAKPTGRAKVGGNLLQSPSRMGIYVK